LQFLETSKTFKKYATEFKGIEVQKYRLNLEQNTFKGTLKHLLEKTAFMLFHWMLQKHYTTSKFTSALSQVYLVDYYREGMKPAYSARLFYHYRYTKFMNPSSIKRGALIFFFENTNQKSISSTFYIQIFCTNVV